MPGHVAEYGICLISARDRQGREIASRGLPRNLARYQMLVVAAAFVGVEAADRPLHRPLAGRTQADFLRELVEAAILVDPDRAEGQADRSEQGHVEAERSLR